MTSKLSFLTQTSLNRKIKTKWFLIVNIVLAIAIIGIINIDSIITLFGGDFNKKQEIYVIDNTDVSFDLFKTSMENTNISLDGSEETGYDIKKYDKSLEEAKEEMADNEGLWVVVFNPNDTNYLDASVISNGYIETLDYQILSQAINNVKTTIAIENSNISSSELASIYAPANIERVILDEDKKTEDENSSMIMSIVFPVVILPFFMLSLFLVQMIGAEVNDEKSTRGMEIIISNVSPQTHFFSKVLAGNIFVLLQGFLLFMYGALGFLARNLLGGSDITNGVGDYVGSLLDLFLEGGLSDKLIFIIPLALILIVLTFIAYSLLAGILASMTTNIEDFQQLQTPIMLISLLGYYLAIMSNMFHGSLLIRIISYVPFISAILSPSLLMLGQIGIIDIIISIILTIITNYLLIKYGLKIYKVGILNYSSKDLWKKMFKAMKN